MEAESLCDAAIAQAVCVIAQDAVEVVSFDRASEFSERRFEAAESVLDLPVIGACMNLREIYRGTGLL